MKYYVNCGVTNPGNGSESAPFKTITEAANIALPGDEVIVDDGIYREHVNPKNAGKEEARITYRAKNKLKAVITGAEIITDWSEVKPHVWKTVIDNSFFGDYNPFKTQVEGDWFDSNFTAHTGDVFLNGKSMYEVTDIEGVYNPKENLSSWDKDFTIYTWYTEADGDKTVIYANFQDINPKDALVEISVRQNCFYPLEEGIGYITLDGFTVCKAATHWAPPTAYQDGMVGPHWSKGWIIENCDIYESKCSGISLGKYLQPNNDNKWLKWKYKDGTQTERDCICQAQTEGWTKENIGSHIVRNNNIHDCGQTGIVGHLGGVFSIIENNHIHHINNKQNLAGAEIGGIKMHAAIDVIIKNNHFHHCTRGLWLDWQAQGTRVTGNLFHDNALPHEYLLRLENLANLGLGEDIFIEVSHGPTLIDNNILLSDRAFKLPTQGVAFVHNLIAGSLTAVGRGVDNGAKTLKSPRYTPYHVPHRTEIAGFMTILHGDMRFYNNIFVQSKVREKLIDICKIFENDEWDDGNLIAGTIPYDKYMTEEEWEKEFEGYCGMGSMPSDRYYIPLPVWTGGNVYFNGAKPISKEKDFYEDTEHEIKIELTTDGKDWKLDTNLFDYLPKNCSMINTETLGMAFEPEQYYENPDGSEIVFDTDIYGNKREGTISAGPFAK
ncbi:MAG: right-handed parallel beta-helix repeat-containing protein [Lachnospiraceae bacterium]|nr:right-handed parallel beta-helix repeat-containing protein [Lachnospiraceae bacterium]